MTLGVHIYDIRPSGHRVTVWKGEFNCENAKNHKRDILKFLRQLETECPTCMKKQTKLVST